MKKLFICIFSILIGLQTIPLQLTFANTTTKDDKIVVNKITNNKFELINTSNGIVDTVEYLNTNEAIVTESNGYQHFITLDEVGNAYNNGILVSTVSLEDDLIGPESLIDDFEIQSRGVNGPWINGGTAYVTRSFLNTTKSVAITIAGFVPGFGYIAGAAAIIDAIWSSGQREIYYKIEQYVDNTYVWQKQICYAYRYSNRTGLLNTTYGAVTRIHW